MAGGPLHGIRVIEVGGIGASPFASMLLADMGADVVRIERPSLAADDELGVQPGQVMGRSRRAVIGLDLKHPEGKAVLLDMTQEADVVTEAFRPGVAERLGIGPDVVCARNPRIVYGRMTGWGRTGPLALSAGHDINYISVAGALHPMGRAGQPPAPPLALVGDMGGGGLQLAFGIVCALVERQRSGRGQIVDAAMVDGAAVLMAAFWGHRANGLWSDERESNIVDGGAPFYDTYQCRDGRYVAVGAIEPQFYEVLRATLGLGADIDHLDRAQWPLLRARLRDAFATRDRQEWCDLLEGTDACVSPVLGFDDALAHPHNRERGTFVDVDGVAQPAPAPRFSRTPGQAQPAPEPFDDSVATLAEWGVSTDRLGALRAEGIVR